MKCEKIVLFFSVMLLECEHFMCLKVFAEITEGVQMNTFHSVVTFFLMSIPWILFFFLKVDFALGNTKTLAGARSHK